MPLPTETQRLRLCPSCHSVEIAKDAEALWPLDWRCQVCGHVVPTVDGVPEYAPELANAMTGMNPAAFDEIVQREEGNFWFEPRSRLLVGLADKFFPNATRYLEIGCGTGAVLAPMAASRDWSRLVGSELHPTALIHARKRSGDRAEFVQMDARNIPARSAFDLIGAFDVLEHIAEDETVIDDVYAALEPGGGFLAAVPQHPALWSHIDEISFHQRRYRRGELERKMVRAGFDIVFSTSYTTALLPMMAASRLLSRKGSAQSDKDQGFREFDIHPMLNAVLRSVLHAEVGLTLRGMCWPVGGSRVVVGRKPQA